MRMPARRLIMAMVVLIPLLLPLTTYSQVSYSNKSSESILANHHFLDNATVNHPDLIAFVEHYYPALLHDATLTAPDGTNFLTDLWAATIGKHYSMNPRVFIVLVELRSQLFTAPSHDKQQIMNPLARSGNHTTSRAELFWAAEYLETTYMAFDPQALQPVVFSNGDVYPLASPNAATYALHRLLGSLAHTAEEFETYLGDGLSSFESIYRRFFGDPHIPLPTQLSTVPFLSAPFSGNVGANYFFDHNPQWDSFIRFDGTSDGGYDNHVGTDFDMDGVPVLAAADGTIIDIKRDIHENIVCPPGVPYTPVTAMTVRVEVNGITYHHMYWHLQSGSISQDFGVGNAISRGTMIGIAGSTGCSTGPHLHFQVRHNGINVDPYGWCGTGDDPWEAAPNEVLWAVPMTSPVPCPTASLIATPNPIPATTTLASTTIQWTTGNGSFGQVYVIKDNEPETLMSQGTQGTDNPAWLAPGSVYTFRLYAGSDRATLLREVVVRREQSLLATQNPIPATTTLGSTVLYWSTGDGSHGEVYVMKDTGPETLMSAGSHGMADPAWLAPGSAYTFRLYAGSSHTTLLREVVVRRELSLLAHPSTIITDNELSSTMLYWSTGNGSHAELYVSKDNGLETLMSSGSHGVADPAWLMRGSTYAFRLYAGSGHTTLLREVIVRVIPQTTMNYRIYNPFVRSGR